MTTVHGGETGGVRAGFFAFTEVTDPSAHVAYNEWHQLDHLPEQMPIPGIFHGQRWVLSPRCRDAALVVRGDLAIAQYVTVYLMSDPLEETTARFFELARALHREDRFFAHRRAVSSGLLSVTGALAAGRVRVSAAAVPYRPNRGIYAVVDTGSDPARDEGRAGALVSVPGVAGVWTFSSGDCVAAAGDDGGSGRGISGSVTVCYLDGDPVEVAAAVGAGGIVDASCDRVAFAGPLETIQPWRWSWFDERDGSEGVPG